jgi:regulator of nucleoside diphosphate kinase
MLVTITDYHHLVGLLEMAKLKNHITPPMARLVKDLQNARRYTQVNIPKDVITMNSRVMLEDKDSGSQIVITLTYPHHADPAKRKISVFSPQGTDLLGAREGDIVSWEVPDGAISYRIRKVIYQPEAEGHFYL